MSITDELREWAHGFNGPWRRNEEMLLAIADRIDVEHERRVVEVASGWGYWASTHVELPKDADGEYIRVGDVLDGYGKTIEVVEMRYGRSGWVIISRDGNAYADTYAFSHRQPDSWERIIEDAWNGRDSGKNLVARCKALAGDAE